MALRASMALRHSLAYSTLIVLLAVIETATFVVLSSILIFAFAGSEGVMHLWTAPIDQIRGGGTLTLLAAVLGIPFGAVLALWIWSRLMNLAALRRY